MSQISITGITGCSPFDIYVCDITNTFCYLVSGSTSIPPYITFTVPPPLDVVDSLLLLINDSCGCSMFTYLTCEKGKLFQDSDVFLFMHGDVYLFENQ